MTEALHLEGDRVQFCSVLPSWMHIEAQKLIASSRDIKSIKPDSASRRKCTLAQKHTSARDKTGETQTKQESDRKHEHAELVLKWLVNQLVCWQFINPKNSSHGILSHFTENWLIVKIKCQLWHKLCIQSDGYHTYICVVFMLRHPSFSCRTPSTSVFLITFITCAWQEHFSLALTTSIALWKINGEMGLSQSRRVKGCWWWWWWWQGVWAKWSFERKCGEEKQKRGKTQRCLGSKWRGGEKKQKTWVGFCCLYKLGILNSIV